ncbi:MAG: UDP-3-O-(3-hydroxymyristoyl)glucosamine N-acyltransferase [Prosthecobacter sp.]|uniref:UDP-3-O-(3-hydroxymyristoyl)glucosamine N-acyltransferase n=1 Tax=Prosthecobacter sp. TaxID=1965333 RepID=UPI00390134D2
MKIVLADLATLVGGTLLCGDPAEQITGFASLKEAVAGDLSFFHDARYNERLVNTKASAILVPLGWTEFPQNASCIAVSDPSRSFEQIVEKYGFQPEPFAAGVHVSAVIAPTAKLDPARVSIGPHAVIEAGVELGDEVEIGAGCFVGRNVKIGKGSKLYPNATVHAECILGERVFVHSGTVIGADGFGYEFGEGRHRKVRQAGIVQIDNDVEVGAGTTVDRARFGRTWIGEGTKIDNLVQIAHNVVLGRHCILCAQVGISGSTTLEDYVIMGGQSGAGGHITIAKGTKAGGRAGLTADTEPGAYVNGNPAMPYMLERRLQVLYRRLPDLFKRLDDVEKRLAQSDNSL